MAGSNSNSEFDNLKECQILQNWCDPEFKPQRTTLGGHATKVTACLEVENNYVITSAVDNGIRVYDLDSRSFLFELLGHEDDGGVWGLKCRHGMLVSGSRDGSVRVWDIKRRCCTHVFKGHSSSIRCLEIVEHKNVEYIVSGSRDSTLRVWRLPEEQIFEDRHEKDSEASVYNVLEENPYSIGVLRGHKATVRTLSGHGNIVISASYDKHVMVWDIVQMKCLYILEGHTDRVYCAIYDYERQRCISTGMDTTIKIWDLQDISKNAAYSRSLAPCTAILGAMLTLHGHNALVGILQLSDKFLISASGDGQLRVWGSDDYSCVGCYQHSDQCSITALQVSDDLLVSGSEAQLCVHNLRSGELVHSNLLPEADQVWQVYFKGKTLVIAFEKARKNYVEILDFGPQPVSSTS